MLNSVLCGRIMMTRCAGIVILLIFCVYGISAETTHSTDSTHFTQWTEKQLCSFIESGFMKKTLGWQITSFASYNEYNKEIKITTYKQGDLIHYKLSIPLTYYDTIDVSTLSIDMEDRRDPKVRVRSEQLKAVKNESKQTYDFTLFCPEKYLNASYLYVDGFRDGVQCPLRIWLCGFNDTESL